MSKLGNYLTPALGGTAVMLIGAFGMATAISPKVEPAVTAYTPSATPAEPAADPLGLMAHADQAPTPVVYDLGRPALPEEVAAWDIDIRPDGAGLPDGSGDVWTGEELYIDQCAVCHGDFGEAIGRWPVLAGGQGSLTDDRPVKTIGSYWPYLSTVYDYVHRAMPFGNAQSLSDDDVYAITAYLLYLNDLVDDDFVLDRDSFTAFEMPNQGAFYMDDRAEKEYAEFTGEPCMENCVESVEITARAMVVDVTPEDEEARLAREAAAEETPAAAEAVVIEAAAEQPATEDAPAAGGADPELVAAGERVFKKCSSCHQVGEGAVSRTGPHLNGIVGQTVGAVEGFRYSNTLKDFNAEGRVWTEEELTAFLTAPRDYAPGTKMSFRGLRSDDDLAAVVAYLGTLSQ